MPLPEQILERAPLNGNVEPGSYPTAPADVRRHVVAFGLRFGQHPLRTLRRREPDRRPAGRTRDDREILATSSKDGRMPARNLLARLRQRETKRTHALQRPRVLRSMQGIIR